MSELVRRVAQIFYKDRNYRFWAYQCGGWAGYSLATFLTITVTDGNVSLVHIAHIALQAALGILVSWPMRPLYRATFESPLALRIAVSTAVIISFSAVWTALRIHTFALISGEAGLWREFHYWYFGSLFVFLSWSVLYYSIHYYELLVAEHQKVLEESALREREKLRRVRAESTAREAQLKMLRYQLNPHFLFNTLNAINARVRLGENRQAGDMIQHLSRFLRHSLDQGSEQTVSLELELEALELYLEIEQARFGDRLGVTFDVQQMARNAIVPSLILQPIVENAMKFAVSQSETGGTVAIIARVIGDTLELQVRDSGPGMADPDRAEGMGIGLKNTRERLGALYDNYELTMHNCTPSGLLVTVRLPFGCAAADGSLHPLGQAV